MFCPNCTHELDSDAPIYKCHKCSRRWEIKKVEPQEILDAKARMAALPTGHAAPEPEEEFCEECGDFTVVNGRCLECGEEYDDR